MIITNGLPDEYYKEIRNLENMLIDEIFPLMKANRDLAWQYEKLVYVEDCSMSRAANTHQATTTIVAARKALESVTHPKMREYLERMMANQEIAEKFWTEKGW